MSVKITRTVDPRLKIEVVEMTDRYGAVHLVQQSILPLADSTPENQQLVRDWHEAIVQMESHFHQQREDAVTKAVGILAVKF